ncbi:hypothetical protein A2U01_0053439 [Trifolium medium]|uniref:Uncharacterized protein n=1 Tax=Trifolium medium TaxID=97028 RepID=A0A392R8P1_9FABA|nr:hypothetical protein [Trifolium medium]
MQCWEHLKLGLLGSQLPVLKISASLAILKMGYKNLSSAYFYVAFNAVWSDMTSVNANDFMITGFQELSNDLVEAARAHCQLIVVSK